MLDTTSGHTPGGSDPRGLWDDEPPVNARSGYQGTTEGDEEGGFAHHGSINAPKKDKYVSLDGTPIGSCNDKYCTSRAFVACLGIIALEMLQVPHDVHPSPLHIGNNTLVLISLDGYAANYFHNDSRAHCRTRIDKFASQGFFTKYLQNVFATKTFPNHYSIVTGLVEEAHGIINNNMYDPKFDSVFTSANVEPRWWEEGEPIWMTANKSGLVSGTMFWPGSNVKNKGIYPTYWFDYQQSMPFNSRVDQVLQWLQLPDAERPRIITLYMDQPDTNGHAYGPYSAEVTEAMCHVDAAFGHLLDGVEDLGLTDQLNIVLLADHGMAELSQDRVVYLGDYTDTSKLAAYGGSPVQSIFPNEGVDSNDIYNDLVDKHPAMNVYKKTDLPAHMHYEHNRRIGDVVAVGEIGWQIKVDRGDYIGLKGDHGYSEKDEWMHPIFMGRGPQFVRGGTSPMPTVKNIDLYNMMCHIIGAEPAPNNGTFSKVKPFLVDQQ